MLESQFGEKVGDKMKIAIMTSMLPPVIQDFACQNVTRDVLFETYSSRSACGSEIQPP